MSAQILALLEDVFGGLLTASWQASVLAVLVLAVQWALGARLNPRWRYALWLLVLGRLLLPVQPESALSLFRFAPAPPAAFVAPMTEPLFSPPLLTAPMSAISIVTTEPHISFSFYLVLALIWLAGAMILFVLTWRVNRLFAHQVARSPEVGDPVLLGLFAASKNELNIRRSIRLVESGQVQSPAIMGLFQPTLLLPVRVREKFDETELRLIFLHELAHLKRGDVIVQGLIALLQILHWFNPVLWFAFRRMRMDREPATDALVLSRAGEGEKERYGLMLIKLLEHFNQRHSLPTLVGILEEKDQFKRRFSLIARFTRGAYGWSLLGIILIGILSVACLTKSKANGNAVIASGTTGSSDSSSNDMVRIGTKVIQISEEDYQAHRGEIDAATKKGDVEPLSHLKSFDLISEPAALIRSGEKGVIEAIRIFPYADQFQKTNGKLVPAHFIRKNIGVRFPLAVTVEDGKIILKAELEFSALQSWVPLGQETFRPVFSDVTLPVSLSLDSGEAVGLQTKGIQMVMPQGKVPDPESIFGTEDKTVKQPPQRLFLFLNAKMEPAAAANTSANIQGRVIDPDGQPARSAKIGIGGTTILGVNGSSLGSGHDDNPGLIPTSATGEFSLPVVPGGKTIVVIDASGYALVPLQDFKDTIQLRPWARVEGQAFIGSTPASKVHVTLRSFPPSYDSGQGVDIGALAVTDEKGAFAIDRAPAGIVALLLLDGVPGHLPVLCHHLQTASGQTSQIVLGGKGALVTGKVSLPANRDMDSLNSVWTRPLHPDPAPKSVVSDRDKQAYMQAYQTSPQLRENEAASCGYYFYLKPDGSFRIENVPAGSYSLSVWSRRSPVRKIIDASFDVPANQAHYEIPSSLLNPANSHADALRPAADTKATMSAPNPIQNTNTLLNNESIVAPGAEIVGSIKEPGQADESLTVRAFLAPPHFFHGPGADVTPTTPSDVSTATERMSAMALEELSARGVQFPSGSTVTLLPESGKLVVRDTPEQLDLIGHLIEEQAKVDPPTTAPNAIQKANALLDHDYLLPPPVKGPGVEIVGKLKEPGQVDFSRSSGLLLSVDGVGYKFGFAADGSFTIPHVQPGVYNRYLQLVSKSNSVIWPVSSSPNLEPINVEAGAAHLTMNITMDRPFDLPLPAGQVEINLKVATVDEDDYDAHRELFDDAMKKGGPDLVRLLLNRKSVDLISTPSVTTNDGKPAHIDIVREFPYPTSFTTDKNGKVTPDTFTTADVGIKADAIAKRENGKIQLNCALTITDFDGFTDSNMGVKLPTFHTVETHVVEEMASGELKGVWIPGNLFNKQTIHTNGTPASSDVHRITSQRILLFLSARDT
jgi:beta-lactamase regulating signal transducer with metallopeptidase domain